MSADRDDCYLARPDIEPADPSDPSTIDELIKWAAFICTTIASPVFTKEELFAEVRVCAGTWQIEEDALETGLSMASYIEGLGRGLLRLR